MQSDSNRRSERLVKLLFWAVAIIYPVQYHVAKSHGEPYPALMMPAFDGARLDQSGRATADIGEIVITFSDGQTSTQTMRTLFSHALSSHFQPMANMAFKPKPQPPPDDIWGRTPLQELIHTRLIPGRILSKIRNRYWAGVRPEVVAWLRSRLAEMFPNRIAVSAEIVWYTDIFTWHEGQMERQRVQDEIVRIDL